MIILNLPDMFFCYFFRGLPGIFFPALLEDLVCLPCRLCCFNFSFLLWRGDLAKILDTFLDNRLYSCNFFCKFLDLICLFFNNHILFNNL